MKATLKKMAVTAMLALGAFSAITYVSCTTDKCKDVVCKNSGTCNEGSCTCTTGYSGSLCDSLVKNQYQGTYKGNGTGSDGSTFTNATIQFTPTTATSDPLGLRMQVFDRTGSSIVILTVHLTNNNTFNIDTETQGIYTYSGSGTINTSTASASITQKTATGTTIYTFNNMQRI